MRLYITAILIILICTLSAVVQAQAALDHMTITSRDWMVANGADTSAITVTVYDEAGYPIRLADVTFRVNSPWVLWPTNGITDNFGMITTTLRPTTKSGAALITVNVSVLENGERHFLEQVYTQNIDHGTPYRAIPIYNTDASVGSTTTIQVNVTDVYGNPVDNRNMVETVQFAASGTTDSGFWDGTSYVRMLSVPVDSDGIARVTYLVTKSGSNFVDIQPPSPIYHKLITIYGIYDGSPFSIIQAVTPGGYPYPYTRTDGSKFTIAYTLLDKYGNPAADRDIQLSTSVPGEERVFTTNSNGVVAYYYQKSGAGLYTLTATAADNATVTCSLTVEFIAGSPMDMLLTAQPQTMASRDVNESLSSSIFGKVIDEKGNPVQGEVVTFTILSFNTYTYNQTRRPSLENGTMASDIVRTPITGITDADGFAEITFRPGAFTRDTRDPKFSYHAQGKALIQAVWKGVNRTLEIQYMNYPYLSVETFTEPKTLDVNGTVNISILLTGNGWALQPKPIDVVLLTDRSGSMLFNETLDTSRWPNVITSESPDDRMDMAIKAGKLFVDKMANQDRIGVVSFGDLTGTNGWAILFNTGTPNDRYLYGYSYRSGRSYYINSNGYGAAYYSDDMSYVIAHYPGHGATGKYYGSAMATVDLGLTYDKSTVKNIISQMVPNGGTPMRRGLYQSVKQIINDPDILAHKRDNAVRAIVLLTDGAWNTGGDPRGGSGAEYYSEIRYGSVITWAKNNNIKIFTIALGSEPYKDQLQFYADQTGGKAYIANSGLDLAGIYSDIAGQLHTEAGVGTNMVANFSFVDINSDLVPGIQALDYVCIPPISTHEFSSNLTVPVIVDRFYDQTADWEADQRLQFNVGTIFLGQIWEANFSMKVLRDGNIKILDSNSTITFNDGSILPLPDTYITARPADGGTGPLGIGIWVTDVRRTDTGTNPDYVDIAWNLRYTGQLSSVQEDVELRQEGTLEWSHRLTKMVDAGTTGDSTTLDISGLPSGTWYVRITAQAADAGYDTEVTQFVIQKGTPKIKIL